MKKPVIVKVLNQVIGASSKLLNLKKHYVMDEQKRIEEANSIIRNHIVWSMGMGAIPLPVLDFFAVSAVQLDMVRQLSRLYGLEFKETEGKALITSLTGAGLAQLGARAAAKLIPGVGSVVGGIAMSAFSGASTYAIGQVFREHFDTGGTFLDFDPARLKKYYQEQFEKGKKVAKDIKKEEEEKKNSKGGGIKLKKEATEKTAEVPKEEKAPITSKTSSSSDAIFEKLKELAQLKEAGVITEEEFSKMKARVIEKF